MTLDQLIDSLPSYAKDLRLNFSSLVRQQQELTKSQLWGTLVASAVATRTPQLLEAVLMDAAEQLSPEALEAAKAAAAIMAMTNIYYRFLHLSTNPKYATIPSKLRMNVLRTHGTDSVDFELWSLAVSAINGCGKCVDSHENVLRQKGVSEETIAAAIRVAAVIHAIGTTLEAESVQVPQLV
ncbi:MAG: carboxymuconolactone decarboxylase family protein [Acidobacteriales bacterium]|nr:carboxymuconolactone decarboxylase family protein [Terriglobales bacterium]